MTLKDKTADELLKAAMNFRLIAACLMERVELLQKELRKVDPSNVLLDLQMPTSSQIPLSLDYRQ